MAHKKLIKVSNVCQLLDKSKYNISLTVKGVTFTNNGDGSITVNGTATDDAKYVIQPYTTFSPTLIGHTCLIVPNVSLPGGNTIILHTGNREITNNNPIRKTTGLYNIMITVSSGNTANNLVFRPQFFDLTEMYGAGNEPTTVEEFRQDFPEEMYDYSPHCWLTSYKRVIVTGAGNYLTTYQRNLTCKTKNLFDINSANVTIQDDGSFISNISYDSYFYSLNVTPGQIYTVSYYTTSFGAIGSGLNLSIQTGDYYRDGEQLFVKLNPKESDTYYKGTFTIPEGATKITFSCMTSNVYRNFMIELGDTTTDYVPYGHL